ncbi:putative secreted virulence factor [Lumpy skin disease virus]
MFLTSFRVYDSDIIFDENKNIIWLPSSFVGELYTDNKSSNDDFILLVTIVNILGFPFISFGFVPCDPLYSEYPLLSIIYFITNPPYVELEKYIKCFPFNEVILSMKYLNLELIFKLMSSSPYKIPLLILRFG